MKEVAILKFQTSCERILEQVRRKREPVRIMRLGKCVAVVWPVVRKRALRKRDE